MKKNMSSADRIARLVIAGVISVLYFTGTITGIIGTILLILGAVFILTSAISFCPLYTIFGISTCKKKSN